MIELREVSKIYKVKKKEVIALDHINLKITEGEFVTVLGKSGSGKSTLLDVIGGLTTRSDGAYEFDNKQVKQTQQTLSKIRNDNMAIIVQNYALIDYKTVYENIELPLKYQHIKKVKRDQLVRKWAKYMDIEDKLSAFPDQLSGGQCQRVAIARAMCKSPRILLADEPTGALDSENKQNVMDLLVKINKEQNMTVVMVTHDEAIAEMTQRIIRLEDGKIVQDKVLER